MACTGAVCNQVRSDQELDLLLQIPVHGSLEKGCLPYSDKRKGTASTRGVQ